MLVPATLTSYLPAPLVMLNTTSDQVDYLSHEWREEDVSLRYDQTKQRDRQ
jgi:hypothetical protein